MSDSEADLDDCNFADQDFYQQVEPFSQNEGRGEQKANTRESGMSTVINSSTMEHAYRDRGTCTKGGMTAMST